MKHKPLKRVAALALTVVMLLSYIPVATWAVDSTTDIKAIQKPTGISIVEDYDDYIGDNWLERLELPKFVTVTLADNTAVEVPVTWDTSTLDTRRTGFYSLPGTVTLPAGATNGQNLTVTITVQVRKAVNLFENPGFESGTTKWGWNYSAVGKGTPAAEGQYAIQARSSTSKYSSYTMLTNSDQAALAQRVATEGAGQYYISGQVRDYLYSAETAHTDELSVNLQLWYKKNANNSSKMLGETKKATISDEAYTTVGGVFDLAGDDVYLCTYVKMYSDTAFVYQSILIDDMQFIPLRVTLKAEPANVAEIKSEILSRTVVRNYPDYVGEDWKTALGLPTSVEVLLDSGVTASMDVTWSYAGLDFTKYGKYTLVGTLDDSSFPNPKGLTVKQNIYVGKAKNLISNPGFETNLNGWYLIDTKSKPGRVQTPVKEGEYAAMTGRFPTTSTSVAYASTLSSVGNAIGDAIAELGGGQFYYSAWTQYSEDTLPSGISIDARLLHKTKKADGTLTSAIVTNSSVVPLSNKEYTQAKNVLNLPANTGWIQLALYASAPNAADLGVPLYVDNVELIPLNVVIPKGQEPSDVTEVLSEIPVRAIVENYDSFVGANWKAKLGLPETVEVRTANGNIASVDVEWDFSTLNLKKVGKYTLIGTLDNSAYPNPQELFVTQIIYITEYKNLITNPGFEGSLNGWYLIDLKSKASRVDTVVKEGKYAAMTGNFPTTSKRVAFAYTLSSMGSVIGDAIAELGGGQFYYSTWVQYSQNSMPSGIAIETNILHKTKDENGELSKSTISKSDTVPLSNKEYTQTKGIIDLPSNTGWVQMALYVSAQNTSDLGVPLYVDKAELIALNVIVEQYEGEIVQVETIIAERQIVQNYPDYIGEGYTTKDLMLPETVNVRSSIGQTIKVGVKWDYSTLDLTKIGTYTVYGTLEDMKIANPNALTVKQNIRVVSKKNLLGNPSFESDANGWDYSGQVSLELGNTTPVRTGSLSMKLEVGRLDAQNYNNLQAFYNAGTRNLGANITKTGAGRYFFGGWLQGTESTNDLEFAIRMWYMCLSTGDQYHQVASPTVKVSTTEFTQLSNIIEMPGDVYSGIFDVLFIGTPQQMRLSTLYMDDFELIPLNIEIADLNDIISCEKAADVYVHEGSSIEGLNLPEELRVTIKNNQRFDLGVTWDTSTFDPNKIGVQTIIGSLNLGKKYKNTMNFVPTVKVTVRAKGDPLRETIYLSTSGDDNNNGLSPETPKKDVKKIPTYLAQGYNVLLKRGDTWYTHSGGINIKGVWGTEDVPLIIGAYGSGSKLPTIAYMMKIENSAWKLVDAKRNVYAADVSSLAVHHDVRVHRCFVNDEAYTHQYRTNYVTLDAGECCDYGGKIYIRMSEGEVPKNVEVTPMASSGNPLRIEDARYLNIEHISFKGMLGLQTKVYIMAPTEHLKFRYCSFTHGFYYQISFDARDDGLIHYKPEISNCYIDANYNEVEGFWNKSGVEDLWATSTTEGITLREGVDGAWIHHNTIRNMAHVFICIESLSHTSARTTPGVYNCIIEDNVLEGVNSMYARPFSFNGCFNLSGTQMCRDNTFRRNRCYDMSSACHFFGENNLVYSNLFCFYHTTYNEDGTLFDGKGAVGSSIDQTVFSDRTSEGNMLVNNTFYNVSGAITINDNSGVVNNNLYANNLMVNWSNDAPAYPGAFNASSAGMNYVMNNAAYSADGRTDPFVINKKIYSAEDVNNSVAGYSNNVSGDPKFVNVDLTMLDRFSRQEFDLSKESPFRYAGLSLYHRVYKTFPAWKRLMEDYTDVNGVVYLAESPSIGAYSFCEKIKGDVAEVGKLEDIIARPGAKYEQLNLPDAVPATNDQGIDVMLLADWNTKDADFSKPGIVTLTASLRNGPHTELNINGKTASININIKDKLKLLNITTILRPLTVLYGTSLEDTIKQLPQTLDVMEESGYQEALPVTWICNDYNPTKSDSYIFKCILPEDMLTNPEDFDLRVEVRVLHEIGRGMELLINPDFIDGTSAAPWKIGWALGNFRITQDPQYLMPGEPAAAIVTVNGRYGSIQQSVLGQLKLMGDGQYLFKVYMRAYEPGVTIDSSVPCIELTGPKNHLYLSRTKTDIGTDWIEYNTVMHITDVAQATEIMFHTSTYKTTDDVDADAPKSFVIAGCSLIYLGNTDAEVEATMDSIGLDWNTIRGENGLDKVVTTNLNLPTSIGLGSEIKWSSSDESAITNDGKVTMGRVAKTVTLTATITYNGIETVKKFNVTVPRNPDLPTFTGSLTGSQAVNIGDEFKVTISLAGEKATTFNAYRWTLSFNTSKLEYVSCSDAASTVEVEGGKITISGIGTERPITDTITLTFKAKKSGITEVKLVKVEMDLDPNASLDTLPTMTVTEGTAMIDVQKVGEDDEAPVAEQDDSGVIWIIIALVAAALICGGVIAIILIRKKKQAPTNEN